MIASGIIRRIDDLGRIVIPKEIRKKIGIFEGEPLELFYSPNNNSVILKKYSPMDETNQKEEEKESAQTMNVTNPIIDNFNNFSNDELRVFINKCNEVIQKRENKDKEDAWEKVHNAISDYTLKYGDIEVNCCGDTIYFNHNNDFSTIGEIECSE